MPDFICTTCGTQHAEGDQPPAACAICHDPYSDSPRQGPGMKDLFRKKYLPSGAPANDERVREVIRRGRRNMPAFENAMDEKQLDDLIAFLHAL